MSKRKEHQEVEFISVYNKRLQKSFFKSRNVRKPLAQSHGLLQQQVSQQTSTTSTDPPPTHKQHTEAEKTPFSTSSVAGGPEYVPNIDAPQVPKKKKQGRVGNLHVVLLNEVWMLTIFSPRMNFSKIGYPYEQPI